MIGLAIAFVSGLSAMGSIAKNKAPQLAMGLQPANGFAAENLAAASVNAAITANNGSFPNQVSPRAANLAMQAFLAEPATPEAVGVLALLEAGSERRKLMDKALLLSRRQQMVTLWMINDSAAREDITSILQHYDTMLRTSSSAASVIMPQIAAVLANEDFIQPLARLLATNPPWSSQFWAAVVGTPSAIGNAAQLRQLLYKPSEPGENYRDADLINALANDRQFAQAAGLYRLLKGEKKNAALLENHSFEKIPEYPPMDWQLMSTGEYGAAVSEGKLQLSAIRNSGGLFARQIVDLPPKVLTIEVIGSDDLADDAQAFLSLSCAEAKNNAPQPIRIALKNGTTRQQISNVNSGCRFYWLDISARASENGDGFDVSLNSISMRVNTAGA